MVVSHYVVSWIQVVGLIVGLYGFFFLSIPIFGEGSVRWLRPFLPAVAVGLGMFIPFVSAPAGVGGDLPVPLVFIVVGASAFAYYIGVRKKPLDVVWILIVTINVVGLLAFDVVVIFFVLKFHVESGPTPELRP